MRRILFAAAALLGAAVVASAATVPYRTDAELVAISNRVVRGRVLDSVVERGPSGVIRTRTRVAVIEDFTGGTDTILTVLERGGQLQDGSSLWIPGAPRFVAGDDVVLCLERTADGYRTVSMAFSAFRVGAAVAGNRRLTRFGGTAVVGGSAAAVQASRGLDEFRRAAAAVTGTAGRQVMTDAQAAAAVTAAVGSRVTAPFTLLGPLRWREADSGQSIAWYRNTLTPSPVQGGDVDVEIPVALSAWTDPPGATITLTYGGTRFDVLGPESNPYCTAANLGAGLITFGDPFDELPFGVLAIGGGCGGASTHDVNGQTFSPFTHGLVVLNDAASIAGYTSPPNITRILEHEVGHAIGLGHTDLGDDNIMYPSCCSAATPVAPALGPDDLAALLFIYPPCVYTFSAVQTAFSADGGDNSLGVTSSTAGCTWLLVSDAPWLSFSDSDRGSGSQFRRMFITPNPGATAPRSATVRIGGTTLTITQGADVDEDGDGLFDGFERFFNFPLDGTGVDGPAGDPDGDGRTNLEEQALHTHPKGLFHRYLAEGVANAFFSTEVALFNPSITPVSVVLRLQAEGGAQFSWPVALPPLSRRTVSTEALRSLTTAPFSTLIEADREVIVDRTMRWDATGYGAHAETAIAAPSTTWYLAEGSTAGDFSLFYLLQNPGDVGALATIRFLRPSPLAPIVRQYAVAPHARLTIPVDTQTPALASTDVSAEITATQPIIVERSMYLDRPGQPFAAGHESAGVTGAATDWFLAEGATGPFFDLFLLIANPGAQPALVQVDYLLPDRGLVSKEYAIAAASRFTIWVDEEEFPPGSFFRPLANTPVSMRIRSLNTAPIIVERAMWWPQPAWYEAHNAAGTTVTGLRWGLAGGTVGGPNAAETYVLIANPANRGGGATVSLYFEGSQGLAPVTRFVTLLPESRTNVAISSLFPEAVGKRFGILVESYGETPVPIVVERAMYESPGGVTWAAGTAVVATRLTP